MARTNPNASQWNPEEDGVTHIWVSPQGRTALGRALHIAADRPIIDERYGKFSSIYAFWLWYDADRADHLRTVTHGSMLRSSFSGITDTPGGRKEVVSVLHRSLDNDPELRRMLLQNTLPLALYEIHQYPGVSDPMQFELPHQQWYLKALNDYVAKYR